MDASQINKMELKWQKRWAEEKIFEPDPDPSKEKRYITAAFPYPNSPQHIGHGRTYTTADVYARYLRMRGYHVLFPMAFHVTGTPILAMAKRIEKKNPEVLDVFENIYGIDAKTAESLTDPTALVNYFSQEIEQGMHEIGYSIDWRRKFYSFDPKFNRFIQWQFRKLKQKEYLIKGEYPIAWCPSDGNAVSAHDTKGDVDPESKEFTAVKFEYDDGYLITATLRPETIYGVTNIWVNTEINYVKAKSERTGEIYYMSPEAFEKLNFQNFQLSVLGKIKGEDFIGRSAKNLVTGEEVPIYKGNYVKSDTGTGIVMSVPSHAPYDHIALVDMGINLEYTQIIDVKGYKFMAKELIEQRNVKDQHDPKLEDITKEVYKKEILCGKMLIGPFKGEKVSDAIEKTKQSMFKNKQAIPFWELSELVFCRCGTKVVVNILKDQWFIDYGIPGWKEKAKKCLGRMQTIPEETRSEFLYTIDWLMTRPTTRAAGLGTRFPFDETKMIEALSDSTIYMAYYAIAHLLDGFDESELDEEFFDAVFLQTGPKTRDPKLKKLSESFLYWYPCDSRHSAGDLIRNHLTLYIFNHAAIFPEKHWPKQIVTNGFVMMDGTKMSKSMGNILPLRKAIKEYGADVIRFSVVSGADLTHDTDFNKTVAEGMRGRLEYIDGLIRDSEPKTRDQGRIDRWLLSRLNRRIQKAEKLYGKVMMRHLALEIFYDIFNELKWYEKRAEKPNLKPFFDKWVRLIAPFLPHFAEEWWSRLGHKELVVSARFPVSDESAIDENLEKGEELIKTVHSDVEKISGLIGKKPESVFVYVAEDWKRKLYNIVKEKKRFDTVMQSAAQDPELKTHMKQLTTLAKQLVRNAHSLPEILSGEEELSALKDAESFLSKEFECNVTVLPESEGKHDKAKNASPGKPAIVIE